MKSLLGRFRYNRLASDFTILATLSACILVGSMVAAQGARSGISGQQRGCHPLKVPAPRDSRPDFSRIAKEVGPGRRQHPIPKSCPNQQQQNRRRAPTTCPFRSSSSRPTAMTRR